MPGEYGLSRFGFAPFGGAPAPFGVVSAVALNQNTIRVIYSALCNLTDPKLTDPSKYVLTPSVAVNHVGVETAASVILYTSQLTSPSYTLTVSDIVSWADRVLNPNPAIVTFGGRIVEGWGVSFAVSSGKCGTSTHIRSGYIAYRSSIFFTSLKCRYWAISATCHFQWN